MSLLVTPLWESVIVVCFAVCYFMSLLVTPIVGVCNCSMFCCTLLYVPLRFVIILMGKGELIDMLSLSSWCLVIVVWLFLAVPWVSLQFVIVVFSDHTHLLFFSSQNRKKKQNLRILSKAHPYLRQ